MAESAVKRSVVGWLGGLVQAWRVAAVCRSWPLSPGSALTRFTRPGLRYGDQRADRSGDRTESTKGPAMVAMGTSRLQDAQNQGEIAPSDQVMDLLEEHVPISLLMDLVAPAGPDSRDILDTEGAPEQAWWDQS